MKTALILGASGETGKCLLKLLSNCDNFDQIISLNRRFLNLDPEINSQKIEQKVVDFSRLQDFRESFENVDTAFCCLGSSLTKASKVKTKIVVNFCKVPERS